VAREPWKSNAEILREAQEWYREPEVWKPTPTRYWLADTKLAPSPYYDWPPLGRLPPEFVLDEDGLVRRDRASPDE
jgi:hypothetical protein